MKMIMLCKDDGVFVFILCLFQLQSKVYGCSPPFQRSSNNGCYFFYHKTVASARVAQMKCGDLGGYLVNINSEDEHYRVSEIINGNTNKLDAYWMGAWYNGQEWTWLRPNGRSRLTQVSLSTGYQNWGPGELDNNDWDRFGAIKTSAPFTWISEHNTNYNRMGYICERDW